MGDDQARGGAPLRASDGFLLRGRQVTRIETFVDAAFAFSLTLLVIFQNDLPQTVSELRGALLRVPTFALCFVMLAMFWAAHNRWSRRFGMDDARSTVLSLGFVLVVLVYVYPLRMVISSFVSMLTGGWLPSELGFDPDRPMLDLQTAFIVYGIGFGLLSWIVWALNRHALRRDLAPPLSEEERHHVRSELGSHAILGLAALSSVLLSLLVLATGWKNWFVGGLPMWVYATLSFVMPWYWARRGRGLRSLRQADST